MSDSLEKIRGELAATLERSLQTEALACGLEAPPGLFAAVAAEPGSRAAEMRAVFGARAPLALVGFDTPGLQEYVFKTRRPIDVYGGSRLIADFTNPYITCEQGTVSLYCKVDASDVVYAGGGSGVFLTAASRAEEIARNIEEILWDKTHQDLHSVAVVLTIWPADLGATIEPGALHTLDDLLGSPVPTTAYCRTLNNLFNLLSRARSAKGLLAMDVGGKERRCEACGERAPQAPKTVCSACEARRGYGFRKKCNDTIAKCEVAQPSTFDDLLEGYSQRALAVLYADGANVGGAFQKVASLAEHRRLSVAVEEAFHDARIAAIKVIPQPRVSREGEQHDEVRPALRAQYPICGGDDLVLILPATGVFAAAEKILEIVESRFDRLRHEKGWSPEVLQSIETFGVGIGIVIAAPHFPVRFLLEYAHDLLESAKAKIRQKQDGARSAVDFLVLRTGTPLSHSIEKLRAKYARNHPRETETQVFYTRRPYSRPGFHEFLHKARHLANVESSQIQAIRREIERGYETSLSLWRYQHARAKKEDDVNGWTPFRNRMDRKLENVDGLLWQNVEGENGKGAVATDFLDAAEILDFVEAVK